MRPWASAAARAPATPRPPPRCGERRRAAGVEQPRSRRPRPACRPGAAPAAPPPPQPDPPYVAAAKSRKKVPIWAAPVLAVLPLWGFIYYQSLQKPPAGGERPARPRGADLRRQGRLRRLPRQRRRAAASGAKLNDGEVLKTFKNPLGHGPLGGLRRRGRRPGQRHLRRPRPPRRPAQHRHAALGHAGAEGQAHPRRSPPS